MTPPDAVFAAHPRRAITRTRLLPLPGEVLVSPGDTVGIDTVIARARIPGRIEVVPVCARLGIPPEELERHLAVRDGESVATGQLLASHPGMWGLSKTQVRSPCPGVVLSHSTVTGTVLIEGDQAEQLLYAFVRGTVRRVLEKRGAVIEGAAGVVQAAVGVGPEVVGPLAKWDPREAPQEGSIVFVSGRLDREAMTRLVSQKVRGALAGSVHADDLMKFVNRPIDPASTVDVETPLTLAFTEGFGEYSMSEPVLRVLESLRGRMVGLSGRTQVRAGACRPELIAEPQDLRPGEDAPAANDYVSAVRIVRGLDFGKLGRVVDTPRNSVIFESGIAALAYVLELENGRRVTVPRVNTEKIVFSKDGWRSNRHGSFGARET